MSSTISAKYIYMVLFIYHKTPSGGVYYYTDFTIELEAQIENTKILQDYQTSEWWIQKSNLNLPHPRAQALNFFTFQLYGEEKIILD